MEFWLVISIFTTIKIQSVFMMQTCIFFSKRKTTEKVEHFGNLYFGCWCFVPSHVKYHLFAVFVLLFLWAFSSRFMYFSVLFNSLEHVNSNESAVERAIFHSPKHCCFSSLSKRANIFSISYIKGWYNWKCPEIRAIAMRRYAGFIAIYRSCVWWVWKK